MDAKRKASLVSKTLQKKAGTLSSRAFLPNITTLCSTVQAAQSSLRSRSVLPNLSSVGSNLNPKDMLESPLVTSRSAANRHRNQQPRRSLTVGSHQSQRRRPLTIIESLTCAGVSTWHNPLSTCESASVRLPDNWPQPSVETSREGQHRDARFRRANTNVESMNFGLSKDCNGLSKDRLSAPVHPVFPSLHLQSPLGFNVSSKAVMSKPSDSKSKSSTSVESGRCTGWCAGSAVSGIFCGVDESLSQAIARRNQSLRCAPR